MTLRASFNEDIFSFLSLYLPDYQEQVKIGDMLYNMEQKIQLNKQICAELEAMAKTIYDYWFVQFDFPDENGKPYRTSGGEMVWNEQLKREIPKGWSMTTVGKTLSKIPNTSRILTRPCLKNKSCTNRKRVVS
jgi:type I restriction enzyme S subunit